VARQEAVPNPDFYDEQVWTFLLATGYAVAGGEGVAALTGALTGGEAAWRPSHRIWFEVLLSFRTRSTGSAPWFVKQSSS